MDTSCGTTSGRPRAAPTSATAASACGTTISSWRRRTTTWSRWTRRPARSAGTKTIADVDQGYFSTPAPIVIGNHVLVGDGQRYRLSWLSAVVRSGNRRAAVEALHRSHAEGRPGLDTWASLDAARHGGAQTWITGAYDPETKLYIFGTGNPTPAFTTGTRGDRRQPLHLLADCAERGYRQDGLVLPDLAARHA